MLTVNVTRNGEIECTYSAHKVLRHKDVTTIKCTDGNLYFVETDSGLEVSVV
jgi:hypothetical protein